MNLLMVGILFYIALQLAIGFWVSKKIYTQSDFLVAGRSLNFPMAMFSIFATWFGAETCVGTAQEVYENGFSGALHDPIGYSLCIFLLGFFLAIPLWNSGILTLGDLYKKSYGRSVEMFAVLLMVPTSMIWAGAQIQAFGQVLSTASGGALSESHGILLGAAVVIVYTTLGGLLADAYTDFVQGIVLILGLCVLVYVAGALATENSGLNFLQIFQSVPSGWWNVVGERTTLGFIESLMIPVVGSLVAQELVSRTLASRSKQIARSAALSGGVLYFLMGFTPVLLVLFARHIPGLNFESEAPFLPELALQILSPFLFVVFSGALISAILSTVDSTLLASGGLIGQNLHLHLLLPEKIRDLPEWQLRITRLATLCSAVVATGFALGSDSVFELVELASSFSGGSIFVITLFALLKNSAQFKRFGFSGGTYRSALISMVFGQIAYHGLNFSDSEAPFVYSTLISFFTYIFAAVGEDLWTHKERGTPA